MRGPLRAEVAVKGAFMGDGLNDSAGIWCSQSFCFATCACPGCSGGRLEEFLERVLYLSPLTDGKENKGGPAPVR